MLLRFRQDVIHLVPKAVVILAGTNDIAGNTGPTNIDMIMDNIKSMTELAQANHIKVVLCSVLPANRYGWSPEVQPADTIIALNELIKDYARSKRLIYVDFYTALVDEQKGLNPNYGRDSVHPNLDGYKVMEPNERYPAHRSPSPSDFHKKKKARKIRAFFFYHLIPYFFNILII